MARLRAPDLAFPCRLAFFRPSTGEAFEALIPTAPGDGQWGAVFGREGEQGDGEQAAGARRPVLRGFRRLPGPLARRGLGHGACRPGRVLRSINGTPLPDMLQQLREEVGGGGWGEVEARLQAALRATPLPASLVLRDMEALGGLRRWLVAPAP